MCKINCALLQIVLILVEKMSGKYRPDQREGSHVPPTALGIKEYKEQKLLSPKELSRDAALWGQVPSLMGGTQGHQSRQKLAYVFAGKANTIPIAAVLWVS